MHTTAGRERWSSRLGFILVATGAAAGLGNIWKFPYIVGEYGGGAFMLVYLAAILVVGLPILGAEFLLGRLGNHNVIDSLRVVALRHSHSAHWSKLGWIGLAAVFVVLSFYSVVGGWTLAYLHLALTGAIQAPDTPSPEYFSQLFDAVTGDPLRAIFWHSVFMAVTAAIVASGVRRGIERLCRAMMPVLLLLLLLLAIYGAVATDRFGAAVAFLSEPDFSKLTAGAVQVAVGHAFFTLSIGTGAMLTFGSYLPRRIGLTGAAFTIAGLDTLVAILAALAIFPIALSHGIETGAGPGLVFVSLPIAFSEIDGGAVVGIAFFALLVAAALTSSPSLLEPMVEYLRENSTASRRSATVKIVGAVWLLGIGQALSFSVGSDVTVFGKNLFGVSDFLATGILLPLGGILIALFAGWALTDSDTSGPLGVKHRRLRRAWRIALRYVAPLALAFVLFNGLIR